MIIIALVLALVEKQQQMDMDECVDDVDECD